MAWTENIPQPNDRLSISQGQILGNFTSTHDIFDVDHYTFDFTNPPDPGGIYNLAQTADRGKHKKVGLMTASGNITTVANEIGIWVKNDTIGNPQLFMRQASDGAVTQITGTNIANNNGQFVLPSGFLMKWGRIGKPLPAHSGTIVYLVGGDNIPFTHVWSLQLTLRHDTANQICAIDDNIAPTHLQFSWIASSTDSYIYWLAIGSY